MEAQLRNLKWEEVCVKVTLFISFIYLGLSIYGNPRYGTPWLLTLEKDYPIGNTCPYMVVLFVSHLSYFFFRLIFLSSRLIYTSIISFIAFFFYGIGVTMFVRFIRFIGIRCVLIGSLDVWGFKKLRDLIWHCWRSGVGGCMLIWVDCDLRCWKLSMGQWVDCDFFFFVR